jgi:hypothetical protein
MTVALDSPRLRPVSINDAADLVGLSLSTLRTYRQVGRSDLVRDLDYYVHRRGLRHRIYFTREASNDSAHAIILPVLPTCLFEPTIQRVMACLLVTTGVLDRNVTSE